MYWFLSILNLYHISAVSEQSLQKQIEWAILKETVYASDSGCFDQQHFWVSPSVPVVHGLFLDSYGVQHPINTVVMLLSK